MGDRKSTLSERVVAAVLAGALGFGVMTAAAEVRELRAQDAACSAGQCDGFCRAATAAYGYCNRAGCTCVL